MSEKIDKGEFQYYEFLVKLREWIKLLDYGDEYVEEIESKINAISMSRYKVAVMGEFNRGKSSLINALLGSEVLPTKMLPTTAVISKITYGIEKSVEIHYKNGKTEQISIKDLAGYVTKLTDKGSALAAEIEEAVVTYPTQYGKNGIDIYDTPGLNDNDDMSAIADRISHSCDTVLMSVSALAPFSETECKFTCGLIKNENIRNIIFVLTFIDEIGEEEAINEQIEFAQTKIPKDIYGMLGKDEAALKKAETLFKNMKLCGVSCSEAIKAAATSDMTLLKKSRFAEFRAMLTEEITKDKYIESVRQIAEYVNAIKNKIVTLNSDKLYHYSKEIDSCDFAYRKYGTFVKESDKFFKSRRENYSGMLNIGIIKNNVMKIFINGLGSIKSADDITIRKALGISAAKSEILYKKINADIKKALSDDYNALENMRIEFIHTVYSPLQRIGLIHPYKKMPSSTDKITDEKFSWLASPIPSGNGLYI